MSRILVSGLVNIETTVCVESFPIAYETCRFPFHGVNTTVSGVGYNIAKALTTLGDDVRFCSLIGRDFAGDLVLRSLPRAEFVLRRLKRTAHSAILYDRDGRRQVNCDLKDIQEQVYPATQFNRALRRCDLAALCNINFSRSHLARVRRAGIPIATDVHAIARLDDEYNADFMRAANILFLSDESLECPPEDWARRAQEKFGSDIIVIGLGAAGALLAVRRDGFFGRLPAAKPPKIVNTIGAGDALFSAFVHFFVKTGNARDSLRKAMTFAAHKIGVAGAADGFLSERALLRSCRHER
jgi:ribokinase